MRLRQRDMKTYIYKKYGTFKEIDGTKYTGYEREGREIKAKIQPAGGKMLAEIYGLRLQYMLTMYCEKGTELKENDGICVYVDGNKDPDYKIIAIRTWGTHIVADLERI